MLGSLDRFGSLTQDQRAEALDALRRVQQFGYDMADPDEIAQAASIAPDTIRDLARQSAMRSPAIPELQRRASTDYGEPGKTPGNLFDEAMRDRNAASKDDLGIKQEIASGTAGLARLLKPEIESLLAFQREQLLKEVKSMFIEIKSGH